MSDTQIPADQRRVWSHDALALDLAGHLRGPARMVWCDLQLGPSGSVRPDVYTILKSFTRPAPTAYEVKVSRADFLADVTAGKWQSYLRYAEGCYFACESGLIGKAEVPTHAGLIVRHPSGAWRIARRATLAPVTIPQDAWLKLLIDGVANQALANVPQRNQYAAEAALRRKLGATVARVATSRLAVELETDAAKRSAELIVARAHRDAQAITEHAEKTLEPSIRVLREALGLPADATPWQIAAAARRVVAQLQEHPAVAALRGAHAQLTRVVAEFAQEATS